MKPRPVIFDCVAFDDETIAMVPQRRFRRMADRQFVVGEEYILEVVEPRDMRSHRHFFATIHEIWKNLPETDDRFPTSEHLRKWALVQTGYCTEKAIVCETAHDARLVAAAIRDENEFAVITVKGNVVKKFEPRSQSTGAGGMKNEEFKASKKAVFDLCESLIPGMDRDALHRHVAREVPPDERKPKVEGREADNVVEIKPATAMQYFSFARIWITAATDRADAWERWQKERDLRDELAVPVSMRATLETLLREMFNEEASG